MIPPIQAGRSLAELTVTHAGQPTNTPSRTALTRVAAGRLTIVEQHPATQPGVSSAQRRLVAVCGVCGGAGTSTLAYLLAQFENRALAGEVLITDTGGPDGKIAALAGVQADRSLSELAEHVHARLPIRQPVATTQDGLRVLATAPRFTSPPVPTGRVRRLLDQARERYALTVIDCGTLARDVDQAALACASHAIWLLPATRPAFDRARLVFDAINPHPHEILAARPATDGKAPVRQLKRLARERAAPLVLLTALPELHNHRTINIALDTWQVPLQAIHGLLHRQRDHR